jgi:hypothetical protein
LAKKNGYFVDDDSEVRFKVITAVPMKITLQSSVVTVPRRGVMYLTISLVLWYKFFGIVYPGSMLVRIRNNLLCTFFLLALMDLDWSYVFITRVVCNIDCPVIEASSL